MIATKFLDGSGIGNMLWNYAVTRAIAKHNGYKYCILDRHKFKGQHFLDIDYGEPEEEFLAVSHYREKMTFNEHGKDISTIDEYMYNIPDNTEISGTMQSLRYFEGISKQEIQSWIKIKHPCWKLSNPHIHIRGGDFIGAGNTLLPRQYFLNAMEQVRQKYDPIATFFIITDHPEYAKWLLPEVTIMDDKIFGEKDYTNDPYQASHHIGKNIPSAFKILAASQCNIISNSSFSWWASYLNPHNPIIVAPFGWAGYNYDPPFWSTSQMRVSEWNYLDNKGFLHASL